MMNLPNLALVIALTLLITTPGAAQTADSAGSSRGSATQDALPAGWTARPDNGGRADNIKFVVMKPGYHLTLGPATILYRTQDRATGPFHAIAKFHQMKKLEHPEGYGLFFGGKELDRPSQTYNYFLVRQDGRFIIKRRVGETLSQVTEGWEESPAVKQAGAKGMATNVLEIDAKTDPERISFKVNGKEVHSMPAKFAMGVEGIVGIRANHHLDLHLEEFAIH